MYNNIMDAPTETPSTPTIEIRYSSYTPAQKRATQKYRLKNKDKVNEQRKKYYTDRKEKDPEFLKYKREKAKEYYKRKKASSTDSPLLIPDDHHIDVPLEVEIHLGSVIESPILEIETISLVEPEIVITSELVPEVVIKSKRVRKGKKASKDE